jgi:hypothetical protein
LTTVSESNIMPFRQLIEGRKVTPKNPPQLYVVTRKPRASKPHYRAAYWFTRATSKAEAVRQAAELLPDVFGRDPYREFNAPQADLVTTGGPANYL